MSRCEFEFLSAVRGFHVYRDIWKPYVSEILRCEFEPENQFDMFSVKVCSDEKIVGHIPREISRPTKFLLDRGAQIFATIRSTAVRRSPLFQGGLEVMCTVKVSLPKTVKAQELLDKYKEMVLSLYTEPDDDVIVGTFLTDEFATPTANKKKKIEKKKNLKDNNNRSIHDFFKKI